MKKTITERMLMLWQDPVAAEAHAVAVASAAEVSVVHEAEVSQAEAALEEALSVADRAAVLEEVLIILPHPLIITITARSSGVQDVARYFMVVAVVSV